MELSISSLMHRAEALFYKWWNGKNKEQRYKLELYAAIVGPGIGLVAGMLLVTLL